MIKEFETTNKHTIFYETDNKAGGRTYYSDEIGCGVMVWDTCLVDMETLQEVIEFEKKLRENEDESNFILLSEQKPEPKRDIEYIDDEGNRGYAYLCACCKKEWRCTVSGGGLAVDVIKWRYINE